MDRGIFIAIDGIDGCGSTTQTKLLGNHLKSRDLSVHLTKEPSDLEIGCLLRKYLKKKDIPGAIDALLYAADRIQHYTSEILPKINEGFIVISDRYLESSIAYQTAQLMRDDGNKFVEFEFNTSLEWVENINKYAPHPDATFILDIDPELSLDRKFQNNIDPSTDKYEEIEFLREVRKIYIMRADSLNFEVINAEQPIDIVNLIITQKVDKFIQNNA
jgi:dTMP kinase